MNRSFPLVRPERIPSLARAPVGWQKQRLARPWSAHPGGLTKLRTLVVLGSLSTGAHAETASREVLVTINETKPLLRYSSVAPSAASTVLTGASLGHSGDTAADVLRQVPGVQLTRSGAATDSATASIRGADAKQVPVYLAGVRLNDEVNGAADLSTIPLWMMQRVELFRGNAPAYQADLGVGGAVYFEPITPSETRLGFEAHAGSFGRRGGGLSAAVGNGRSSALVSLRASAVQNDYPFLNDHGLRYSKTATEDRRVNADAADMDGWVLGNHQLGRLRLHTVLHAFDREQGTSGIATTPARAARTHQRRLLGAVSGTYSCPTTWTCLVLAQASLLVGQETLTDPDRELRTIRADWQHTLGTRGTFSARAHLGLAPGLEITPIAVAAYDTLELTTPEQAPRLASRSTTTLGVEGKLRATERITAFAMVRGACYDTDAQYIELSRRRSEQVTHCPAAPDARLGFDYAVAAPLRLVGNLGHVWREPTLGERYGISAALQGEPQLRPERSFNVDLGTRGTHELGEVKLSWDAFLFRRASDDLVRYRQTSLYSFAPYNVGRTLISGAEVALASELPLGFFTQSTLTVLDPRDTTPTRRGPNDLLPMTSRLTMYHELRWTHAVPGSTFEDATLGGRYYFRSSRYADPAGLVVLPAVQSVDVYAQLRLRRPEVAASASINNLLDQRTLDYLGLPVPGRSLHASLTCWW